MRVTKFYEQWTRVAKQSVTLVSGGVEGWGRVGWWGGAGSTIITTAPDICK